MQTSKKPFSPFFCYQQYVIDELANQNPNLKPSELTALIANKWNSLPPESRSKYEIMYKEAVEIENAKIEQSGVAISPKEELEVSRRKTEDDEGVFGTKIKNKKGSRDMSQKFLVQLYFGEVSASTNKPGVDRANEGLYTTIAVIKKGTSDEKFFYSWDDALGYIQKAYLAHLRVFEKVTSSTEFRWWKKTPNYSENFYALEVTGQYFHKNDSGVRYTLNYISHSNFSASIFDFREEKKINVPEKDLRADLSRRVRNLVTYRNLLIVSILKEKPIGAPQVMKDVISMLPKEGLSRTKVKHCQKIIDGEYCGRASNQRFKAACLPTGSVTWMYTQKDMNRFIFRT